MFNEENTKRLIYTGNEKCRKSIYSCETQDQLDVAIDMCNSFGKTVCNILNSKDFKYIGPNWNMHRRWCKRTYGVLNASLTELDALITERRSYIEEQQAATGTVGFK